MSWAGFLLVGVSVCGRFSRLIVSARASKCEYASSGERSLPEPASCESLAVQRDHSDASH